MAMRRDVSDHLDAIDKLEPGTGHFNAFVFGAGDVRAGSFGLGLDYAHRLNSDWSAFAAAEAGYYYGDTSGLGFNVRAGLRGTF